MMEVCGSSNSVRGSCQVHQSLNKPERLRKLSILKQIQPIECLTSRIDQYREFWIIRVERRHSTCSGPV